MLFYDSIYYSNNNLSAKSDIKWLAGLHEQQIHNWLCPKSEKAKNF